MHLDTPHVHRGYFQKPSDPAGRRNDGKMKRFRPWKQKLHSGERAGLREYYYVFGRTDADILLRGLTVRNPVSLFLMVLFTRTRQSIRLSVCPLVASFFPVQFAGEDVETSRAFSTEPYVLADLLLLFKHEVSCSLEFVSLDRYLKLNLAISYPIDRNLF